MKIFTVNANDANQRLDKFLLKCVPSLPLSLLYKSIRKGRIKINGRKASENSRLETGDELHLYINDEFFTAPNDTAYLYSLKYDLNIVYEDENLLISDKPAGLIVHSDEKENRRTLINYIKAYLIQKGEYDPNTEHTFAPSLCHRIDRGTSGLVIAAKNAEALRIINEKIKHRELEKYYRCTVSGIPSPREGILKHYLWKDSKLNRVYVYDSMRTGAKEAQTIYRVTATAGNNSTLEIKLISGRTHQIRAQLAHIGHPLLGDGKYGRGKPGENQHLRAFKIVFNYTSDAGILNYLTGKTIIAD